MANGASTNAATGLLQVNAFFGSIGRPAKGVTIRIFPAGESIPVQELVTNEIGQIPPIPLPAPPLSYSMSYDRPQPFSQYDVEAILENYPAVNIRGVQIFPDTTAVQRAVLTPKGGMIDIPYPTLWGDFPPKIPEDEIKPLPHSTNLVVLPRPVVPDVVVVHAGVPSDSSAPNYTVGLKDYIKNVACSEIYSTWPPETLRANVLAILSFAMNRIYTEWYRGKGYDFTITNSTAYDQAFTYGRTIFREVSNVVNELFTTYISRLDILQPLLTQYVDGKSVPPREGWLSQWGSKALGDQGLTAIQILKNYYGSEIILKQAQKVEGIPLSFPGETLKPGSTGESVRTIQTQLNAISNNYPLISKVVVDGVYGESTEKAVRVFQEIFGLPVTGNVNFPTWYQISNIYVAVAELA